MLKLQDLNTTGSKGFRLLPELPDQMSAFPRFRYMGSKYRLLPWIRQVLASFEFETAVDAFSGSAVVSYLLCEGGPRHSGELSRL